MINEGATPRHDWTIVDAAFTLKRDTEQLSARTHLTPKPAYRGVCGFPVPTGLFINIHYTCAACGTVRLDVSPFFVKGSYRPKKTKCLKLECGSTQLIFSGLSFEALNG